MQTTTERNMEIAHTIAAQLGGYARLAAMIGARDFVALDGTGGLQFKIGKGATSGINSIRIVLDPSDTYRVEFWRVRRFDFEQVGETATDVYADTLRSLIESRIGMVLSLGTLGRK